MGTQAVLTRIEGVAGRITLNRPEALNALTPGMVRAIAAALEAWRDDPAVRLVVLDGAGERAFCAGGDVAGLWRAARAGDMAQAAQFWAEEYALNLSLSRYPKPVVGFLHGFVMGGGVGLGCHLSHRIVGESTQMAMPECAIGLIPDVGGTWLLGRAPGRLGVYLALTAARMGPGDAIHAGFADGFVPQSDWSALMDVLCAGGDVAALPRLPAPPSALARDRAVIDRLFAAPDPGGILAALAQDGSPLAMTARAAMARHSPLAMACTLALLSPPPDSLAAALAREHVAVLGCLHDGDFLEGVRALLIDKDRAPRWRHSLTGGVPVADVAAVLTPPPGQG